MLWRTRTILCAPVLITTMAAACGDSTMQVVAPSEAATDSVSVSTSVRWNQRAVALLELRQPASNGQAAVSRILTYLSLAQYRAVTAAQAAASAAKPPSVSAAIGGASTAVLNSFFPLDVASTEAQLNGDNAIPPWPSTSKEDVAAGDSLGRTIGAAVLAQAATDNYLVTSPGVPPIGPDKWVSSSAAIVRSMYGARPFFLTSASQLRSPPPPAFGSAQYFTALAEVRQISDTRTATQLAIALNWNAGSGPFVAGRLNLMADDLIRQHRVSEAEAARILAFANAAAFDAQIACFDTKFTYWFIRPPQADPLITLAIAMPNHPSYPSGHSCVMASFMGVVSDALPTEKTKLDAMVDEAGMSRIYGGIHYRFDIDAGRVLGQAAAALALKSSLK